MIKILDYNTVQNSEIFARSEATINVEDIVTEIIANVRKNGDKALFEYCEKLLPYRLLSKRLMKPSLWLTVSL